MLNQNFCDESVREDKAEEVKDLLEVNEKEDEDVNDEEGRRI